MTTQTIFKEQGLADAQELVKLWAASYPQAAIHLQSVWASKLMVAGHKTMGRTILGLRMDIPSRTEEESYQKWQEQEMGMGREETPRPFVPSGQ